MSLESAIPEHLQQERTIPAKTPSNFQPPFPAYSARFPRETKDLVVAIIGAQYQSKPTAPVQHSNTSSFLSKTSSDSPPQHFDLASVTDTAGYQNEVVIAYWASKALHDDWVTSSGFGAWWADLDAEKEPHGWFREIFFPAIDRFETVFSDNIVPEGAAHLREGVSGTIREHVYWGSMRDRLPASQTDGLPGEKSQGKGGERDAQASLKKRINVPGRQNLAIIRSGQDWSNTSPHERQLYLETMHPVLIKGMDFLRDNGEDVGCYSCRFMDVLDSETTKEGTEKTFGLAYFDDLASLEGWSKDHQTHLDIFGRFLRYAAELQGNVSLRLFHEVLVLKSDQQLFEYVGCHGETGMLSSI